MKIRVGQVSPSAIEDAWQRRATERAIEAARGVVKFDGPIPPGAPVGRLGDVEWGWIISAALFGWISTRAEQATSEGLDVEKTIQATGLEPDPWDGGAVSAILPELAEACPGLDWSKPLTDWSREVMIEFLLIATRLIRKAMAVRDASEKGVTRKSAPDVIARQTNAAAGGPLMTPDELNDPIELKP